MDKRVQQSLAERFQSMHEEKKLLILPNAWDAGSARMFEAMGFDAVATTSGGMAWSLGYADGEQVPLDELVAAISRMVRVTSIPLTVDFEAGYGESPADVAVSVGAVLDAGVVGINLEDGIEHRVLRDASDAASRIAAAREVADKAGVPLVINARVDTFMVHGESAAREAGSMNDLVKETIRRAQLYLAAGANCIYPIALSDPHIIETLCREIEAPVNIGARAGMVNMTELSRLGVSRVSLATRLATVAYSAAKEAAQRVKSTGGFDSLDAAFSYADLQKLFT